jgi:hypothetical protein
MNNPMRLLQKATYAMFLTLIFSTTFQCSSPKAALVKVVDDTLKPQLEEKIVFQEWFAGIKVGGTGINMFIFDTQFDNDIVLDSVYFRNMKGKLTKGEGTYSAVLKNDSPHYSPNPSNSETNPFNLSSEECMIGYKKNGIMKYVKVSSVIEKAGTYYENGHPSIHQSVTSSVIATVEEN